MPQQQGYPQSQYPGGGYPPAGGPGGYPPAGGPGGYPPTHGAAGPYSQHQAPAPSHGGLLSSCTGNKKALLVGINYFGQSGELRGCINDVNSAPC